MSSLVRSSAAPIVGCGKAPKLGKLSKAGRMQAVKAWTKCKLDERMAKRKAMLDKRMNKMEKKMEKMEQKMDKMMERGSSSSQAAQ